MASNGSGNGGGNGGANGNSGDGGDPFSLLQADSTATHDLHATSVGTAGTENTSGTAGGNPWMMSPAVTITQSELSLGSCSGSINHTSTTCTAQAEQAGAKVQAQAADPTRMQETNGTTVEENSETAATNAATTSTAAPQPSTPRMEAQQQQQQQQSSTTIQEQSPSHSVRFKISPNSPTQAQAQAQSAQGSNNTTTDPAAAAAGNDNDNSNGNAPKKKHHNLMVDTSENMTQNHLHDDDKPQAASGAADAEGDMEEGSSSYQEGGRLWKAALKEAEKEEKTANQKGGSSSSKPRSRFAESIMERTRSRADPNALVSQSSSKTPGGKPSMVTLGENEGSFILSTALAKKRVRVVQLLLIGLVGLLLGLLGNFFVSTSCHFATVNIMVGQNEKTFEFHFGLWKYSPIESVFQGYPYCLKYDQNYGDEAPIVARIANIVALVAGLISISILWLYLIFGTTDKRRWKWAVRIAVVAGLVQLATLYFFLGNVCQEYPCEFGPGAYLAVFTSVVWFVLACEMHYHMPVAIYASAGGGMPMNCNNAMMTVMEDPRSLVTTMEMTHIDEVTREYITRVTGKTKEDEMPALNMDLKRVRPKSNLYSPTSTNGSGLYIPSPRGTYQAPDPTLVKEAMNGGGSGNGNSSSNNNKQ